MLLGSHQKLRTIPHFVVQFCDHDLLPVSEAKNLGIMLDRSLSWDAHVSLGIRRCFGILIGLSHLRNYLPPSVVSAVVDALALSQIRYCLSVYGSGTQKNVSRIQKVINYAAKIIFGRKKFDHVSDLLEELGWLSAGNLVDYHTLCLVHKVRRRHEPEALANGLTTISEIRDRNTRQNNSLYVPMSHTEMGRRRFCCRAPRQYNCLPSDLTGLSIPAFGRHLRSHLGCNDMATRFALRH